MGAAPKKECWRYETFASMYEGRGVGCFWARWGIVSWWWEEGGVEVGFSFLISFEMKQAGISFVITLITLLLWWFDFPDCFWCRLRFPFVCFVLFVTILFTLRKKIAYLIDQRKKVWCYRLVWSLVLLIVFFLYFVVTNRDVVYCNAQDAFSFSKLIIGLFCPIFLYTSLFILQLPSKSCPEKSFFEKN